LTLYDYDDLRGAGKGTGKRRIERANRTALQSLIDESEEK
jgi:hypothetical protein